MFETERFWQDTPKEKEITKNLFGTVEKSAVLFSSDLKSSSKANPNAKARKKKKTKKKQEKPSYHTTDELTVLKSSSAKEWNTTDTTSTNKKHSFDCTTNKNLINSGKGIVSNHSLKRRTTDSKSSLSTKKRKVDMDTANFLAEPKSLEESYKLKLQSSRFRYINEKMYTNHSKESIEMFQNDPDAFSLYHNGFKAQVAKWPANPLNVIISWIKLRPASLIIADLGCGEATIAQRVKNKVHSFDLCAFNKHVTVADISQVPLDDESVDIAIFCLSLMGKNLKEYIFEASRILRVGGFLKIAEVASRFIQVRFFILAMKQLGFTVVKKDLSNSHFFIFDFQKTKNLDKYARDKNLKGLQLKPCLYKKR